MRNYKLCLLLCILLITACNTEDHNSVPLEQELDSEVTGDRKVIEPENESSTVDIKIVPPNAGNTLEKKRQNDMEQNSDVSIKEKEMLEATVTHVIDGDTLEVQFRNGRKETIRLLLVDTPETNHPSQPVQPYGPEATQFAKEQLENQKIQIEIGTQIRDKYDRLLGYVWINDQLFNEMLLERGLARTAYIYPPNIKYLNQFHETQQIAMNEKIGVWGIEGYAHADHNHTYHYVEETKDVQGQKQSNTSQSTQPILKFDPNGPDRDCGDFDSHHQAQAFYIAAGGPDKDPHRLDGTDNDGKVCESLQ